MRSLDAQLADRAFSEGLQMSQRRVVKGRQFDQTVVSATDEFDQREAWERGSGGVWQIKHPTGTIAAPIYESVKRAAHWKTSPATRGRQGGYRRAALMTPAARSASAKHAAQARWAKRQSA
jgi:hypothetical protein